MYVIVLVACPDGKAADAISDSVLSKRLAACVNVIPGVKSRYWWKGRLENAGEVLLMMKTKESLLKELEKAVRDCHPYEVPEFLAIPVKCGSKDYLDWIEKETGKRG
jgi:periplasmic divalent cation tolerance protein